MASQSKSLKRSDYVHAMFESLARKMNSAQNMNPAIGFNATLTFITYPDKGEKGPASNNSGHLPFKMMHKKKDCMIKITNKVDLCCARAIVTMKEYVDGAWGALLKKKNLSRRRTYALVRDRKVFAWCHKIN